jgi:hypothetical protein
MEMHKSAHLPLPLLAYGAFTVIKKGQKEMLNLLVISAVGMLAASISASLNRETTFTNIGFDSLVQILLIIAVIMKRKQDIAA